LKIGAIEPGQEKEILGMVKKQKGTMIKIISYLFSVSLFLLVSVTLNADSNAMVHYGFWVEKIYCYHARMLEWAVLGLTRVKGMFWY